MIAVVVSPVPVVRSGMSWRDGVAWLGVGRPTPGRRRRDRHRPYDAVTTPPSSTSSSTCIRLTVRGVNLSGRGGQPRRGRPVPGRHRRAAADVQAAVTGSAWRWPGLTVHTIFTTRYAGSTTPTRPAGWDFNEQTPPVQRLRLPGVHHRHDVPGLDTDLKTKAIRATALRHALLSYMFGAIIIATTINLNVPDRQALAA